MDDKSRGINRLIRYILFQAFGIWEKLKYSPPKSSLPAFWKKEKQEELGEKFCSEREKQRQPFISFCLGIDRSEI